MDNFHWTEAQHVRREGSYRSEEINMFTVKVATFVPPCLYYPGFFQSLTWRRFRGSEALHGYRVPGTYPERRPPPRVAAWPKALCKLTALLPFLHRENAGRCFTVNKNFSRLSSHLHFMQVFLIRCTNRLFFRSKNCPFPRSLCCCVPPARWKG